MPPIQFTARFEDRTEHNEIYHQLAFELVTPHELSFQAGQYLSIKVNEQGERRSYSICSSPAIQHGFELLVDTQPTGIGTQLLKSLQFGQEIQGLGPMGKFTVSTEPLENEIIFVATGSGIAPLRSMILDLLQERHDQRPISLYWGMRHASNLFWLDEMTELLQSFPNFRFTPVISQPTSDWTLSTGRVTDTLAAREFSANVGFYLCGNRQMIEQVSQLLTQKGVQPANVHYEKFY